MSVSQLKPSQPCSLSACAAQFLSGCGLRLPGLPCDSTPVIKLIHTCHILLRRPRTRSVTHCRTATALAAAGGTRSASSGPARCERLQTCRLGACIIVNWHLAGGRRWGRDICVKRCRLESLHHRTARGVARQSACSLLYLSQARATGAAANLWPGFAGAVPDRLPSAPSPAAQRQQPPPAPRPAAALWVPPPMIGKRGSGGCSPTPSGTTGSGEDTSSASGEEQAFPIGSSGDDSDVDVVNDQKMGTESTAAPPATAARAAQPAASQPPPPKPARLLH